MNKYQEKSARTKALLIRSFWQLYKEKDIRKISVREITEKAGVYRSTFYLHFTDVFDVLEQQEDELIEKWKKDVAEDVENKNLDTLMKAIVNFYEENGEYMFTLLSSGSNYRFMEKLKDVFRSKFCDVFQIINSSNEFELILDFYMTGMLAMWNNWYKSGKDYDANEVMNLGHLLITQGIKPVVGKFSNEKFKVTPEFFE